MTCNYRFNTFRKPGDYVVLPYKKIHFDLKFHVLPYYSKRAYPDLIIDMEMDRFIANVTGTVKESEIPASGRSLQIEFKLGGQFLFEEDTYLNDCFLVKNEDDARAILYKLMETAIEDIRKPWYKN